MISRHAGARNVQPVNDHTASDSWLDRPLSLAQCVAGLCACAVLFVAAIVLRVII